MATEESETVGPSPSALAAAEATGAHKREEAEKQRRFENYFLGQMKQNAEILRDAEEVDTVV